MSVEQPPGQDLRLECWIAGLDTHSLHLVYEVSNVGDSDVYLFNHLHSRRTPEPVYMLDPNRVFISIDGDTAHITKQIPDVPEDVHVPYYDIPPASLLRRGDSQTEELHLPLPLHPVQRYSSQTEFFKPHAVTRLDFSLGYFRSSELGERKVSTARTSAGDMPWVHVAPRLQSIVHAPPIRVQLVARV